ncbi:MAG: outer membrane beta-barrel protein [Hyphomicrobiaceae bacterium]|nr:outer membrane beta-barrel protein [Hyphomicrobiaceae bacterium]
MHFARAFLVTIALAAMPDAAAAEAPAVDFGLRGTIAPSYAGLKDMSDIPAPIPVPEAHPVREGFNYYVRTDIGYGMGGKPSFSEAGRMYGLSGNATFTSSSPFALGGSGFSALSDKTADSFAGGFGFGAYFTPRLRGDITLEFRGERATDVYGTYSYTSSDTGNPTISGTLHDSLRLQSTVGLVNGYVDILPRGYFSPYVGGGVGLVYHQVNRSYLARETDGSTTFDITGSGAATRTAFAAAAMAGATIAFDHRWAIDINYRALYLQGATVTLLTSANQLSTATVGDNWEHQIRVGLRFNIW